MKKIAITCLILFLSASAVRGGFLDLFEKNE